MQSTITSKVLPKPLRVMLKELMQEDINSMQEDINSKNTGQNFRPSTIFIPLLALFLMKSIDMFGHAIISILNATGKSILQLTDSFIQFRPQIYDINIIYYLCRFNS